MLEVLLGIGCKPRCRCDVALRRRIECAVQKVLGLCTQGADARRASASWKYRAAGRRRPFTAARSARSSKCSALDFNDPTRSVISQLNAKIFRALPLRANCGDVLEELHE